MFQNHTEKIKPQYTEAKWIQKMLPFRDRMPFMRGQKKRRFFLKKLQKYKSESINFTKDYVMHVRS